jgi:hypothetical protein
LGVEALTARLTRLAERTEDEVRIARSVDTLEQQFEVSKKVSGEPETLDAIEQLFGRVLASYGRLSLLEGKRVLDVACGSRSSRSPSRVAGSSPGYTALFEPWFCRILSTLGADPVGVDIGDLNGESFEHYQVDVSRVGALDFLPQHSFDAVHDSRLFGSPEFVTRFPHRRDALRIASEIVKQERRLLKDGGILIHSDALELVGG